MNPVIGIDVAKGKSFATAWKDYEAIYKQFSFLHTVKGFAQLQNILNQLEQLSGIRPETILEATGHYSMPLCRYFRENNYTCHIVNPYISRQFNRISLRKVKTDRIDSLNLCRIYYQERLFDAFGSLYEYSECKALHRACAIAISNMVRQRVLLLTYIDRCFPGFEKLLGQKYNSDILILLQTFPHPEIVTATRPTSVTLKIKANCRHHGKAWCQKKSQALRELAQDCYPSVAASDIQVRLLVETAQQVQQQIEHVDVLKQELIKRMKSDPQFIALSSIPGLGEYQAAAFLAETGDIHRFATHRQLIAFCGVEPGVFQTGKFIGNRQHLTKHGDSHLRAILYMAVVGMVNFRLNPVLLAYYEKKRLREGKPYKVAIFACVNKLLRIIFAICSREEQFSA